MIDLGRTYIVGGPKLSLRVQKYDGSDDFEDIISLSVNEMLYLYDVMSDPNDFNNAIAVGDTNYAEDSFGLWRTTDGGDTWEKPGGNYSDSITDYDFSFREVWYIDSDIIYACGSNGVVVKSIDGGNQFNKLSGTVLNRDDVAADLYSIHFYNESIGVVGLEDNIAKTTNGGTTWELVFPNGIASIFGQVTTLLVEGIKLSYNGTTFEIVAVTSAYVIKVYNWDDYTTSINKELFNSRNVGKHLTWIGDTLWATGGNSQIYQSLDNGDTWITKQAAVPNTEARLAAHYINNPIAGIITGFHSGDETLYLDINQGEFSISDVTTLDILGNTADRLNAVWTSIIIPNYYKIEACEDQDNIPPVLEEKIVTNDLSDYVGNVIKLDFTIEDLLGQPEGVIGTGDNPGLMLVTSCDGEYSFYAVDNIVCTSGLTFNILIPSWSDAYWVANRNVNGPLPVGEPYYILPTDTDCAGESLPECTPLNLSICYTVSEEPFDLQIEAELLSDDTINSLYEYDNNCESCTGECVVLTRCDDETITKIVDDEALIPYIGDIISFDECTDIRYIVSSSQTCIGVQEITYTTINTHEVCVDIVEEEISFRHRAVKPGYYTEGCNPEYTEKINCRFAEEQYIDMSKKRYGIKMCCEIDDMRYLIKKKLLDLKAIEFPEINCVSYNSSECCTTTNNNCNC